MTIADPQELEALRRRLAELERTSSLAEFCPLPSLPVSPSNEEKFTRDERARRERVAAERQRQEAAAAERQRQAEAEAERQRRNAPKIARVDAKIEEVERKRAPHLTSLRPLDAELSRLEREREELL